MVNPDGSRHAADAVFFGDPESFSSDLLLSHLNYVHSHKQTLFFFFFFLQASSAQWLLSLVWCSVVLPSNGICSLIVRLQTPNQCRTFWGRNSAFIHVVEDEHGWGFSLESKLDVHVSVFKQNIA